MLWGLKLFQIEIMIIKQIKQQGGKIKMNYKEFIQEVKYRVQKTMGSGFEVETYKIDKLNRGECNGITIRCKNEVIAPVIYMDKYYEEYLQGKSKEEVLEEIVKLFMNLEKVTNFSLDIFQDFEKVMDKIYFKIVNYSENQKMLEMIPHICHLDLAVVFCIHITQENMNVGSIMIQKDMLLQWNMQIEDIYEIAKKNTPKLFPVQIRDMEDIMNEIIVSEFQKDDVDKEFANNLIDELLGKERQRPKMLVASNTCGINGATVLLYDEELRKTADNIGTDFYILPSSIHEIIILPVKENVSKAELLEMVKEINSTQVSKDEQLSDNVYIYKKKNKKVEAVF